MRRALLPLLAAVALACAAAPAVAAPVATPAPCPSGIAGGDRARIDCGHINVPLRYDAPSPEITIAYARIKAVFPGATDATLMLAGGPGEKLVKHVGLVAQSKRLGGRRLARTRDLILIDQRGVGRSAPALECPLAGASKAKSLVNFYARCAAALRARGIDLAAFNTLNNVRDLDQVRQALGYERVNLFGTSYGARLAQQALRGTPSWVRTAVLSSPVPAEANWVADAGSSFAALSRTFALCRANGRCNAVAPNLPAKLDRAMARLQRRSAVVRIPSANGTRRIRLTAEDISDLLFSAYYSPDGPSLVPLVVEAMDQGEWDAVILAALLLGGGGGADSAMSTGMQINNLCQEEAAYMPAASAARLPRIARVFVKTGVVPGRLTDVCRAWQVPPADPVTFQPVLASTPALIFAGELDQITPPRYAETVSSQLAGSVLVRVSGVGHAPAEAAGACGADLIARFIDDPIRRLDMSCIGRVR